MFKKTVILFLVLLCTCNFSRGQYTLSKQDNIQLHWSIGLCKTLDAQYAFSGGRIGNLRVGGKRRFAPNGDIRGLGISPSVELSFKRVGMEYYSSFKYQISYFDVSPRYKEHYLFLMDHNFNAYYQHKKIFYKIGFTIFNDNASIPYNNGYVGSQSIEYISYNLGLARNFFTRYQVELKINYSPTGYPQDPKLASMVYSLRISYRFDPINPWFWKKE